MKKLLILIALYLTIGSALFAQENKKTVIIHLKNGYSVKGELLEQCDESIKVRTISGEVVTYSASEYTTIDQNADKEKRPTKQIALLVKSKDQFINAGIGFGILSKGSNSISLPPISFGYEYIMIDNLLDRRAAIGIGGQLGVYRLKYSDYWTTINTSKFIIGPKGYFHYSFTEKLDTYAALMLGLKHTGEKWIYPDYDEYNRNDKFNNFFIGLTIGGRYFITTKVAVAAEIGAGLSLLSLGIVMKL